MSRRKIRIKSRTGGDAKRAMQQAFDAVSKVPHDVDVDVDIDTTLERPGPRREKTHEELEREVALLNRGNARLDQENAKLDELANAVSESGQSVLESYRERIAAREHLTAKLGNLSRLGWKVGASILSAAAAAKKVFGG